MAKKYGGAKRNKPQQRKPSTSGKAFLAIMTFFNLILSVTLAVLRRIEVVHAVEKDGEVKLFLTKNMAEEAKEEEE